MSSNRAAIHILRGCAGLPTPSNTAASHRFGAPSNQAGIGVDEGKVGVFQRRRRRQGPRARLGLRQQAQFDHIASPVGGAVILAVAPDRRDDLPAGRELAHARQPPGGDADQRPAGRRARAPAGAPGAVAAPLVGIDVATAATAFTVPANLPTSDGQHWIGLRPATGSTAVTLYAGMAQGILVLPATKPGARPTGVLLAGQSVSSLGMNAAGTLLFALVDGVRRRLLALDPASGAVRGDLCAGVAQPAGIEEVVPA